MKWKWDHECPENTTQNEVWPEITYQGGVTMGPLLTLVGSTPSSHFEHSERITFCPYCGADLRIGTGCGVYHGKEE